MLEELIVNFIKNAVAAMIMVLIFAVTLFAQGTPPDPTMPIPPGDVPPPQPGIVQPPPPTPGELQDRHTFRVSPPELVSPGIYRIGEILVNKTNRTISFPAVVNMNKGLLEYLLVRNGGKTHEALFRTEIEPYNLQIACLLLDLIGTDKPLPFQGAPDKPKGDPVSIMIQLDPKDSRAKAINPKDWITQIVDGAKRDVSDLQWIFTGSVVMNGRFASQVDGSIIALYHDPVAMIDNASPGGEIDKIWFVNEQTTPPIGTPVTITIKPAK